MSLVKSMTGYGRAVETVNGREFTVELRSVNNRYLDCTVKLPRSLSFGEDAVKAAVVLYVAPLVLFFLGYYIGFRLGGFGAPVGGLGFALGILLVLVYDRKVARKANIDYTITAFARKI